MVYFDFVYFLICFCLFAVCVRKGRFPNPKPRPKAALFAFALITFLFFLPSLVISKTLTQKEKKKKKKKMFSQLLFFAFLWNPFFFFQVPSETIEWEPLFDDYHYLTKIKNKLIFSKDEFSIKANSSFRKTSLIQK